jgi:hypothetical protein
MTEDPALVRALRPYPRPVLQGPAVASRIESR